MTKNKLPPREKSAPLSDDLAAWASKRSSEGTEWPRVSWATHWILRTFLCSHRLGVLHVDSRAIQLFIHSTDSFNTCYNAPTVDEAMS